ncbi:MAG: hypothetical protein HY903_06990 [Deltaproteobacteria bacterium]|nr:hypothetical protein [Deltaproteobacteria bacterium]
MNAYDAVLDQGALRITATSPLQKVLSVAALTNNGVLAGAAIDFASAKWLFDAYNHDGSTAFSLSDPGDGSAGFCSMNRLAASQDHFVVLDSCAKGRIYNLSGRLVDSVAMEVSASALPASHPDGHVYALYNNAIIPLD